MRFRITSNLVHFGLRAASIAGLFGAVPALAQTAPSTPTVISPLKVESDHNGVNLTDGFAHVDVPSLEVPAAPRLRFDLVQNAMPYVVGKIGGGQGGYIESSVAVHFGRSESASFRCLYDDDCTSRKYDGAMLEGNVVNGTN